MTAIVEDLLLLARSDSGAVALEHVPVDLGDVAADGASGAGQAGGRSVASGSSSIPQPAVVAGDPARLRQLVMILVDNAIRHSPTDGRVGVAVAADGSGRRRWWSRTTARASGRRTCRTCSSGSIARRARRAAAPAWASRSRHGSSIATAAGSRWPTGPRVAPGSWSTCRRRAASPADTSPGGLTSRSHWRHATAAHRVDLRPPDRGRRRHALGRRPARDNEPPRRLAPHRDGRRDGRSPRQGPAGEPVRSGRHDPRTAQPRTATSPVPISTTSSWVALGVPMLAILAFAIAGLHRRPERPLRAVSISPRGPGSAPSPRSRSTAHRR